LPVGLDVFADPERLIPYVLAAKILENCARVSACAHFGLLLGSRHDHRSLGVPGARMQQARTLGDALSTFVALQHANSRGGAAYLHHWGRAAIFGYGIYDRDAVASDQIYPLVMAIARNVVRGLTNGAARISEVLFSIKAPPDLKPYAAIFGVPVSFGQAQTSLVLPLTTLDMPIAATRVRDEASQQSRASSVVPDGERNWTELVKHRLRPMLLRGDVTSTAAASELGVNVRTMSRRLATEGTSFQRILDEIRFTAACELLHLTDLPIGEIADALSYAASSPFIEAFRRWSGTTPLSWRQFVRDRGTEPGSSPARPEPRSLDHC
jgi:AraC-like DNA-binding protein